MAALSHTKYFLKKHTQGLRLGIAQTIVPFIVAQSRMYDQALNRVPRPSTIFLQRMNKARLVGMEIGVGYGINAESLLKELDIEKLYCIDPLIPYEDFDSDIVTSRFFARREETKKKLQAYPQIELLLAESNIVIPELTDKLFERLDFVYIDGNHSYPYVKEDLEMSYPLLKKGGLLCGHDYALGVGGIGKAVQEFVASHNYELGKNFYALFPDFIIEKKVGILS